MAVALSALERVNAACPDTTSNPCFCTQQSYGLTISCRGYELASVKSLLGQISPAETVAEMVISDIPITDSLVPSDLFAGHQIDRVLLYCYAAYDVDAGLLRFSSDSFSSSDSGECTLTGTFFLQDCNLKQFDFHVFNACDRLTDIEMKWNNLNQVVNFPRMENLLRLKISTNYLWPSTSPFGLTSFDVSVESIPNLKELDLSFNSLQDDQVSFVSQMKNVEQIHLSNNQLSVVPDLTNLSSLQNFVMTLDVFQANLSIYLPNPVQSPVFQFDAYSTFDYVSLNQFKGERYYSLDIFRTKSIDLGIAINNRF